MRVSDSMLFSQASADMDQAQTQVGTLTNEASTGVAVNHAWDNPAAAGLAVTEQFNAAQLGAISQATSLAATELSSADTALNAIGNAIQQAIELAQETGSGIMTAAQQQSAAQSVAGIQNTIVMQLNTQVGSRYIFGGTSDSTAPFDASGDYSGNAQVRQVEVAPGVYQDASVRADVAVKGAGGGVDVFAALSSLQSALQSGNSSAVLAAEAPLQQALQQVFNVRSEEGSNASALQTASSVASTAQTAQSAALSNGLDADEVTVATQLSEAQTVLQAAIDASQKTFQLSLAGTQQEGG